MKYFKCGNCQKPYKIDETKVTSSRLVVQCIDCKAQNAIRFGPILVAQTKDSIKKYSLKIGANTLGRKSSTGDVDIMLDDKFVSRSHATITLEEKDGKLFVFISDNQSLNGTFNPQKAKLKANLKYPLTTNDYYIVGLTKLSLKFN